MEKRVSLVLVCVAICALVSTTSKANLLTDPGAEQEISAPNPNPTGIPGWSFFGGSAFLTTPSLAHSGTNVVDEPGGGGGYSVPGAFQNIPASAGQTFTLSGWVYTPNLLVSNSNDFAILQLSFWTGSGYSNASTVVGVNVGTPIGPGPTTVALPQGVWTFASVTATAPAGAGGVGAYALNINADANAHFMFDDMVLVPEPSTVAMALTGLLGLVAFAKKRRV
jgi:hypothetical protein